MTTLSLDAARESLLSPAQIRAAIGPQRKAALEQLAAQNYRSTSAELRVAIDRHLGIGPAQPELDAAA